MAYPSGWSVIPQVVVKRERWPGVYGARGVPLVYTGQLVVPDQPVLRLLREENAGRVGKGKNNGLPASSTYFSSSEESIEPELAVDSGESIPAGLHGQVVGFTNRGGVVIESRVARIQGIIGAGTPVVGVVTIWQPAPSSGNPQVIPPGAILVVPEPLTLALLHQAISSGVVGIVTSSIMLRDLEGFLRTDVLQLLTSDAVELVQAHLPSLTIVCTEGVGLFRMSSYMLDLLRQYEGSIGLLTGITSVRQNYSPELIISLPITETQDDEWQQPDSTLFPGVQVRVRAGEYQGAIGFVDYFFDHERVFRAGIRARAVRLLLEDGSFCIVPLSLIERIR